MDLVSDIIENRGLIRVELDNGEHLCIRKKHFAALPLTVGEVIDTDEYINRIAMRQANDAYEAALTCLDTAQHTAWSLERKLTAKGYVAPATKQAVERLRELHLIDDAAYAERLVQSKSKGDIGIYAMKRKLMAKGFSNELSTEAVEAQFDESQQIEAAQKALQRYMRRYSDLPKREAQRKLGQALARRGFAWNIISSVVNSALSDEEVE
ncbi:MAG: regulatory protein RecX [Clostridia bacterium]|nr:regulatory protein RecX [Clostridia bacterium]